MDGPQIGLIGGIAGGAIGVLGGLFGTYYSIRATKGPKERRLVLRLAVLVWVGVCAFLTGLILLPFPWHALLWLVYIPSIFWFARRMNLCQAHARAEDQADLEFSGGPT